jgi:predicted RND superfamily exporter protein
VFSLFTVPACLIVLPPGALGAFATRRKPAGLTFSGDVFGRAVGVVGRVVAHRPIVVLAVGTVVALVGAAGATLVRVDEDRIENFGREEAIYRADRVINRLLAGTNVLDIVVSTPEEEDLFQPAHLRRIEALQQFLDGTPHVTETTSIVDFLEQMNRAVHEGRPEAFRLPETAEVAAQYLLLYGASGRSADLESYIDDGYRLANVRAHLDTGRYSEVKDVLGRVERYLQDTFEGPGISATMSGRPVVEHHWMETLAPSTVSGVALAFVGVWLAASIGFGSLVAGLVSLVPVTIAVLVVFAVMGFSGLWLGIGTSMFADIAVGTAVNPALRIIDRVIVLVRNEGSSLEEAFATALPSTGRGLLFDCSATAFGFGVLMTSQVPPLVWFGVLVSVCVLAGLVVTLTILPALLIVLQPSFLVAARAAGPPTSLATK